MGRRYRCYLDASAQLNPEKEGAVSIACLRDPWFSEQNCIACVDRY